MALTLVEIERMLQAAKKKALDMGVIVGISIVDARGDLLAALRLDGALWRTMPVSRGKAYASVAFGAPSAELTERANNPVMRALMLMEEGQIIPQQGAVPIKRGNELLGAIGVSIIKVSRVRELNDWEGTRFAKRNARKSKSLRPAFPNALIIKVLAKSGYPVRRVKVQGR